MGGGLVEGITGQTAAAILFTASAKNVLDVYATLNPNPLSAEAAGGDAVKASSVREYVLHSIGVTSFFGVASAVIAHSWWPIIGTVIANCYMLYLYEHALNRGAVASWKGQP